MLTAGRAHGLLDFLLNNSQVHGCKNFLNRFSAHACREFFAILFLGITEFRFGEELAFFERSATWIDNDKVLVINDALQSTRGHIKHEAQAGWHAFIEPNVRDGHGKVDVTHALTAHAGEGNLNTATVADDAFMLDALILAARAFPIACRTEDTLAEEAAFFRLKSAIIDGLGIFYLSLAPATHGIRGCHGDGHLVKTNGFSFTNGFVEV